MISTGAVEENLHFLILEVIRQVERTRTYLRRPTEKTHDIILRGDDYIDHLRTIIQRKCFALVRDVDQNDRFEMELLKSLDSITANLERIADFCESIVDQFQHLDDPESVQSLPIESNFELIIQGLERIEPVLESREVQGALEICRIEARLDDLHAETFAQVLRDLDAGAHAQSQVTLLFMSHYFERMGDSILNIGEALLSATVGERIKIDQFRVLQDMVEDAGSILADVSPDMLSVQALGETRSGCRIDRIAGRSGDDEERMVVFKEGATEKLVEEKEGIDAWNRRLPGYAPQIYSFQERGNHGAILFEYLPGRTFEEMVLRSNTEELAAGVARLQRALEDIWTTTRQADPAFPRFVQQMRSRIGKVYELHPDFEQGNVSLGGLEVAPFDELLDRAAPLDDVLAAPFSVLGHGDLNVDNVIYDYAVDSIRFIDLHRSAPADYAHDLSVFLVSHARLQVTDRAVRDRIHQVIASMHDFGVDFADRNGDKTFGVRLAMGLARSFITSARFVLDEEFAKSLFFRGRYLLEQLVGLPPKAVEDYSAPLEILLD